jgi:hypothetical protein
LIGVRRSLYNPAMNDIAKGYRDLEVWQVAMTLVGSGAV